MDEIHFHSSSPNTTNNNLQRQQRFDPTSVIQQADVSSSRPALVPHDALGPLLFEALDGFFFTINHNFELDFVSDNVAQYLKYSQEELAGRNLYHYVHPNDVAEFSKAWAKKDTGDNFNTLVNSDPNNAQSRGRTFLCRMRTNDEATNYVRMVVSVAVHRDSPGSDKTFLICIARRPSLNDPKDRPSLLGFDQFSSRINLNYDIESLDTSHMKFETIDKNFVGKNFRDYVHANDVSALESHFQEVIDEGEAKSAVYRFCLHDDVYAFLNTRSKLFSNSATGQPESIVSTHTIVRLIENNLDLNGNACTRLMKTIISSNRDLQRNKQSPTNRSGTNSSTPPIGTQFALTMLGMHKNASNSLQQHVSSTLGNLLQVQNSFTTPAQSSPTDKSQTTPQPPSAPAVQPPVTPLSAPSPSPSQNRYHAQKPAPLFDNVSSSDAVEFGSKQRTLSPSFDTAHSNPNPLPSPIDSLDMFLPSSTPTPVNSTDVNFFLSSPAPRSKTATPHLSNSDLFHRSASPKINAAASAQMMPNQSRTSTRLRQLLANKSPSTNENPSQTLHYHPEDKLDELLNDQESPSTTHLSPSLTDLSSPIKRRRKHLTNGNETPNSVDILLKKILGRENSSSLSPHRTESIHSDDSSLNGQASNKQRSDIFLRTLLNDEVRPQKVVVEAPFVYGTRDKNNQRSSFSHSQSMENLKPSPAQLKSQLSLQLHGNPANDLWNVKNKKKQRQHSNSFGSQNAAIPRKPGRPKRDPSDYLLNGSGCQTPQSTLSNGSLDALLEGSFGLDQSSIPQSPMGLRRGTRPPSTSNPSYKRPAEQDDQLQNARKFPKLLTQALRDDIKMECQDPSIISPSTALAATRPIIKTEPEIFDDFFPRIPPLPMHRPMTNGNNSSTLLRALIRTPQTSSLPTKKDAPLYDLLQNLDHANAHDASLFPSTPSSLNPIDPLEQYLTPVLSQTSTMNSLSSKDDYLASLLTSETPKSSELAILPASKSHSSADTNRISAIAHELFQSTTNAPVSTGATINHSAHSSALSNHMGNHSNEDFLSLLENKDFIDCLTESSTIDSILSQNSTSVMEPLFPSAMNKHSEKDEKAISEIYKTLMTSFNPGLNQQSSSSAPTSTLNATGSALDPMMVDRSPFSLLSGDFFSTDNNQGLPPNRTVNSDPMATNYRQGPPPPAHPTPQQQQQQQQQQQMQAPPAHPSSYSYPNHNPSYSDCLSMDMLDTGPFPPNVTLSPMNNSYMAPPGTPMNKPPMMNNVPMMMYPSGPGQPSPAHVQHHPAGPPPSNGMYRPPPPPHPQQAQQIQQQQQQQQPQVPPQQAQQGPPQQMYNNYMQPHPNAMPGGYYGMPPQQRMSPANPHPGQLVKRQTYMHPQQQQQQQQQRSSTPMNQQQQQLQLHMSMNVTLPHMAPNQQQQSQGQPHPQASPQQPQAPQQMGHRPMMNNYNDFMMANNNGPPLQNDYHHPYPPSNPHDLQYNSDMYMSPAPPMGQQTLPNRHMNMMQQQGPPPQAMHPHGQGNMHQSYPNMSVAVSATIQPNSHNPNNMMNPSVPNLTAAECRQSEELNNQMMNCLSFQPARSTSEFVRKQLQNTIHGRQKPAPGKDLSGGPGPSPLAATMDSNQKGAYFRSQLSSQLSTPPLPNTLRNQPTHPGKPT